MQRLPNVNPLDTTKWPGGIGKFDVGAADAGAKILFYNESPLNIQLDFLNGSTDTLHAWEAAWWELDGDTKQIEWVIDPDSLNVSNPPISRIFLTLYGSKEKVNGQYPMALVRQASVGNPGGINTNVSNTASIVNDGNPTGTVIVESTPAGASASTIKIDNTGNVTISSDNAGTLAQLFQLVAGTSPAVNLGGAAVPTTVIGNLTVNGTTFTAGITASGVITLTGGSGILGGAFTKLGRTVAGDIIDASDPNTTYWKAGSRHAWQMPDGTTALDLTTNGLHIYNGTLFGSDPSNSIIAASGTSGTGVMRIQNTDKVSVQVPGGSEQISVTSTAVGINPQTNLFGQVNASSNFFLANGKTNRIGSNNIAAMSHFGGAVAVGGTTMNHNYSNGTPNWIGATCNTSGSTATVGIGTITSTQVTIYTGNAVSYSCVATAV